MMKINNYVFLEKQLIYITNKLINSKYFSFNKKYKKTLIKYNVEIIQENNIIKCNFYQKFSDKLVFSKIIKKKQLSNCINEK